MREAATPFPPDKKPCPSLALVPVSSLPAGVAVRASGQLAHHVVAVQFPHGTYYVMGEPKTPEVGDKLNADGQEWRVVRVAKGSSWNSITATLQPWEDGAARTSQGDCAVSP